MKRALILGVITLLAAVFGVGSMPTQAQSVQYVSNDEPTIVNEECSVSYSGGSISGDVTNPDENTISIDGTISYQDRTSFELETTAYGEFTSTSTVITASPTSTRTYQGDTSLTFTKTVSSDAYFNTTTTETLIKPTYDISETPILTFRNADEHTAILTVNDSSPSVCGIDVNTEDNEIQVPEVTVAVDEPPIVYPDPISASLSVNDEYFVYVNYGDSATVKWESVGTSSCALDAIGQSSTEGQYVIQNLTSNIAITIECEAAPGYANYQISPEWLARVEVKVLPPTFEYLESYLTGLQPTSKRVNLNTASNFVDQAKRALEQGSTDRAQTFLQKSIDSIKQQESKGLSTDNIDLYEAAVNYLSNTLPVKVVITMDSCSVTATGPSGLILQYGANENMRRGYGDEVTIPESGTITASIYATSGWQATAEVIDSTGLIYAREIKNVTTDNCPFPPVVYDPTVYNGYPEKWAVPEPGTVLDDWGYYNKTAESYIAFRVTDSGRTFPTGYGNASDWLANATEEGYIVENPQAGDIAINTLDESHGGPISWYVDSVDELGNYQTSAIRSDGNMNWSGGTVSGSSYLKYIRLP